MESSAAKKGETHFEKRVVIVSDLRIGIDLEPRRNESIICSVDVTAEQEHFSVNRVSAAFTSFCMCPRIVLMFGQDYKEREQRL